MTFDTSMTKHWNPFRVIAILAVWLVAVAMLAYLASGCGSSSPPPPSPQGSITLTWSIADLNHQPASCAQVGARSVALRLRNVASGAIVTTAFPCPASPATARVPAGRYDIAIALNASDGTTLATAPAQTGVTIVASETRRLDPVTFAVTAQGAIAVSLAVALPATSNCRPLADGGAAITGTTLALERTDPGHEACAPVTFVRRIGDEPIGTYVADNWSSPSVASCVERTETLAASVPAGTYLLHVVGKVGTRDCWKADATLTVTAGAPAMSTIGLARQPGC